ACWFRVADRVRVDDWSDDPAWQARVPSSQRWLSTHHLMGTGYWVWLIPLASGSTSFGIVADAALHPFHRLNRFDRALDWLREFEPQCADVVAPYATRLEDFSALHHFPHGGTRVFFPHPWGVTGVGAAMRRRRGALRGAARRLSRPAALRARLHAGLFSTSLGADGRIG